MPITEDVEVSYELHRYIIGQKGSGIRKMMEEYEVSGLRETFNAADQTACVNDGWMEKLIRRLSASERMWVV